jgi:hypothetical protein
VPMMTSLGGATCVVGALFFWRELPHFRVGARELLRAKDEEHHIISAHH